MYQFLNPYSNLGYIRVLPCLAHFHPKLFSSTGTINFFRNFLFFQIRFASHYACISNLKSFVLFRHLFWKNLKYFKFDLQKPYAEQIKFKMFYIFRLKISEKSKNFQTRFVSHRLLHVEFDMFYIFPKNI